MDRPVSSECHEQSESNHNNLWVLQLVDTLCISKYEEDPKTRDIY